MVQLVDGRHEIQKNDYQMREWVSAYDLPIITVITKTDCISSHNKVAQAIAHVKKEFGGEVFPFSVNNNRYNDKILEFFVNNV